MIYKDDGYHHCTGCGRSWSATDRHFLWPIRIRFSKKKHASFYEKWYAQIGWEDIGVRSFKTLVRIWRFIVILGPEKRELDLGYVFEKQMWFPKEKAKKLKDHYQAEKELDAVAEKYGAML